MKIENTFIKDLKIIHLDVYRDSRGFFVEKFNKKSFADHGLSVDFVQDNFSRSKPGVIRGLHYQNNPSQSKLVGCARGRIWDVAVDIRKNSPTFGKYFAIELSGENGLLLYIPAGFAHGFCVLGDEEADVHYKVDGIYNKAGEGGIIYNDPDIAISWPINKNFVSDKDNSLPNFRDYLSQI